MADKKNSDITFTDGRYVSCDGGENGHPKIYLEISPHSNGEISCPYCSKKFSLKKKVITSASNL